MLFNVSDRTGFKMNYEIIENIVPQDTLFIHGNLSSCRWWYPSVEKWTLQSKNKKYKGNVILAEFRGHGLSSSPRSISEINVHTFANDFLELSTNLKLKNINIVGHSTGGIIAAIMLSKNPELFNKAILLDPVGANGFNLETARAVTHEAMKVNKSLTAAAVGSVIYNNPNDDFFNNVIVEDAYKAVQKVGASVLTSLKTISVADKMRGIPNQVLVIHGEKDTFLPIAASQELASLIPNAKFMCVPEHGHCLNVEDPEKFVDIANNFLFT